MSVIFTEASGVAESIYGNVQAPIQLFLEEQDAAYEKDSLLPALFKMGKSENFGDLLTGMTGMKNWEPTGEGGAIPGNTMREGFKKMLVYESFTSSFAVSREMAEDSRLMNLEGEPRAFIKAYHDTRDELGAAIYAGALQGKATINFGASGKVFDISAADTLPLFHKAHPSVLDQNDKKLQQCNCFADEFSLDALDRIEEKMQLFETDDGRLARVQPDTIVIPLDAGMRRAVFSAIGSTDNPLDASHAFNYQYGRWNVICNPLLNRFLKGGAKPWMVMDSKFNQTYGGAVWNDRTELQVESKTPHINVNTWEGYARFMGTFNNWRFAAAGGMAGGAALAP